MAIPLRKPEVVYVDHMGSDLSVVNAARVSFGKKSEVLEEKDKQLIYYLANHNHFMPFCHAFITLRIKAPIVAARQLAKHQVGLAWSEESRRYISSEPEYYVPLDLHEKPVGSIKQGHGRVSGTDPRHLELNFLKALEMYKQLLYEGVAPEEARMVLPQNTMVNWYWSGSLSAFARVCNLRLKPDIQVVTKDVAAMIEAIVCPLFPISWNALVLKQGAQDD